MLTLYQSYQLPPNSKCIRVLDILPIPASASNSDSEPIKCKLRIINLDDCPRFTALSYVWGTYAPISHFIICDNVKVNITSNCHSALRHLRKKLGKLTIWLDSVCINQDDQNEKLRQIPLMGGIYSIAESVYAWLGDGTAETDRAMAYMANAGQYTTFKDLEELLSKDWITRLWTYQEILLASNPIV
ncbi:HET-domain-containing protein, partial [Melanomma pulvis-pyrius CBS 109.77]